MMVDEETRRGIRQNYGRESVVESSSSLSPSRICQLLMIHMTGGAPFGFRIASIRANGFSPFKVSMIRMNGKAYRSGLQESDFVLAINGFSCCNLITHQSATKLMEYDDPELTLHILRGENICDDNIRSSLQSLDSQILVLTDEEIQSVIAKKLSNQQLKLRVSRSPYVNSPSPQPASPFRLQPPSQARGKLADRRKDRQVTFQPEEQNDAMSYFSYDGSIKRSQIGFNENKLTNSDACSNEIMSGIDLNNERKSNFISDSDRSNREHKFNVLGNDNDAQSRIYRFHDQLNSRTISESDIAIGARPPEASSSISTERTNETHGILETFEVKENQDASELKKLCDMQKQNQDPIKREDNFRSRYRVEQKFEFKPLQQSRYYDADSGQFKEKKTTIPQKRRSNSISSCYMYISPTGVRPSLSIEGNLSFDSGSNHFQDAHFKQGICTDRNTPSRAPVEQLSLSKLTRSPIAPNQYNTLSNVTINTGLENVSLNDFPRIANLERLASPVHYHSASATDRYSGTPSLVSNEIADYPKTCLNRSFPKNSQFSMADGTSSVLYNQYLGPHDGKADSGLTRGRLSAVTAANAMTNASASNSNYADQSKQLTSGNSYRHTGYYSDGGEWNTPLEYMHSSSSKVSLHGPTHEYGQNITEDNFCRPTTRVPPNSYNKPQRQDLNDSIATNEGKGGRLFARRRANSDAWIIGERNAQGAPVDTPQAMSGVGDYGTSYSLPRHRRSSLANRHQHTIDTTQAASPGFKRDCMETPFIRSYLSQQAKPKVVSQPLDYSFVPMPQNFGRQATNLSPKTPDSLVRQQVNLKSPMSQGQGNSKLNFHENIGYTDL